MSALPSVHILGTSSQTYGEDRLLFGADPKSNDTAGVTKLVSRNDFDCYLNSITNLATRGRGRFVNRPTVTGGKKYAKYFVYIPTEVANDSQFPFQVGERVDVTLDGKRKTLSVSRAELTVDDNEGKSSR